MSSLSLKSIQAEAAQGTQAAVLGAQSIPQSGREHEALRGHWRGWTGREGSLSPPEPHPRGPLIGMEKAAEKGGCHAGLYVGVWVCVCQYVS